MANFQEKMKQNNIEMLNDTLGIIEKGSYRIGEKTYILVVQLG